MLQNVIVVTSKCFTTLLWWLVSASKCYCGDWRVLQNVIVVTGECFKMLLWWLVSASQCYCGDWWVLQNVIVVTGECFKMFLCSLVSASKCYYCDRWELQNVIIVSVSVIVIPVGSFACSLSAACYIVSRDTRLEYQQIDIFSMLSLCTYTRIHI